MAQTLQQARTISQLLPTVKCSNCNALVPLTDLGEHICASAPPLSKPPPSPSSLLPARLQGLVSQKPRARQSNEPPPQRRGTPSINTPPPARLNSPGPPPSPFGEPNAAQLSPGWNQNRVPSPLSDKGGLGRNNIALPERTRTNSDSRMEPPRPFAERERALSTGRREPQPPPSPGFRTRTPPNDPRVAGTSRRPSFDSRPSGLFNNRRASRTHPSIDNRRPSDNRSPSAPLRPSLDSRQPNDPRAPNTPLRPSLDNRPSPATRPSIDSIRVPPRQNSYALEVGAPSSPPTVPVPPRSPVSKVEPDTKVGGDAGMAGVGRRGFAAAARAAMFATTAGHTGGVWHNKGGMDDRRPPQFLDINTVSVYCEFCICAVCIVILTFIYFDQLLPRLRFLPTQVTPPIHRGQDHLYLRIVDICLPHAPRPQPPKLVSHCQYLALRRQVPSTGRPSSTSSRIGLPQSTPHLSKRTALRLNSRLAQALNTVWHMLIQLMMKKMVS